MPDLVLQPNRMAMVRAKDSLETKSKEAKLYIVTNNFKLRHWENENTYNTCGSMRESNIHPNTEQVQHC